MIEYNEAIDIGNCFTGVQNFIYEVGKQYDFRYRLELIKANSDYSEFYWMQPWGDVEFLGNSLLEACNTLDDIHNAENNYEELPDDVYNIAVARGDIPF